MECDADDKASNNRPHHLFSDFCACGYTAGSGWLNKTVRNCMMLLIITSLKNVLCSPCLIHNIGIRALNHPSSAEEEASQSRFLWLFMHLAFAWSSWDCLYQLCSSNCRTMLFFYFFPSKNCSPPVLLGSKKYSLMKVICTPTCVAILEVNNRVDRATWIAQNLVHTFLLISCETYYK